MTSACDVPAEAKHADCDHDRKRGPTHKKDDAWLESRDAAVSVRSLTVSKHHRHLGKVELPGKGRDEVVERLIVYGFEKKCV